MEEPRSSERMQRVVFLREERSFLLEGDEPDLVSRHTSAKEVVGDGVDPMTGESHPTYKDVVVQREVKAYNDDSVLPWLISEGGWRIVSIAGAGTAGAYVLIERENGRPT